MTVYRMYISGEWVESQSRGTIDSIEPFTGRPWATIPDGQAGDVDRAVMAAQRAMRDSSWRGISSSRRGHLLRRLAALIEQNAEHLATIDSRDNGKLIREMLGQARALPEYYHYFAGMADKVQGETIPLEKTTVLNYTLREPIGVIGIVTPWNSPLLLLAFSLPAALAAGNAVVVKPSEHASASTLEFAKLVEAAGFPAGVFNVVTGLGHTAGAQLASHPGIGKLCFTGGAPTARTIARLAAEQLTPLLLELGGKSPNIVFDDAVIPNAVNGCIAGIFAAGGQSCIAGSRLLVHENVHDEFLARLIERTRRIRIGNPALMESELGPLATSAQLAKVEQFVERADRDGATLVCGGKRPDEPDLAGGWFYLPTIFDGVTNDMYLAQEEVFGPVLGVLTFRDEDEAVAIANDSQYGLAAGIWTQNIHRAHRVAGRLEAGTVWINTYRALSYMSPFGGYKRSGYGRELGIDAVREFTQTKSVWVELSETVPDPFMLR